MVTNIIINFLQHNHYRGTLESNRQGVNSSIPPIVMCEFIVKILDIKENEQAQVSILGKLNNPYFRKFVFITFKRGAIWPSQGQENKSSFTRNRIRPIVHPQKSLIFDTMY